MKFLKVGRVAIITRGRYAGKKVVIIQPLDTGSKTHPFPHALVAGIERYPSQITRRMSKARQAKRSKVKPFIKTINYNHLMPTRYTLELEGLKGVVTNDTFKEVSQREEAKKTVKKALEERYTSGKNRWFFTPLKMLQTILRYFSLIFPHTFGRLAHWYLLLFYGNTGLLDPHTVIFAILPSCIFFLDGFAAARHFHDDDDDEGPLGHRTGPFRVINDCMRYWFWVYKAFDLVTALYAVLRTSGFCSKVLVAIDMFVEFTLVLLAKAVFFVSVRLFVGAALQGFSYLDGLFVSVGIFVQVLIIGLKELREEFFERNEVPAADEPLFEEEVFEEE